MALSRGSRAPTLEGLLEARPMSLFLKKSRMVTAADALPGRATPLPVPAGHYVNGNPLQPPFEAPLEEAVFGMGCFWGAERLFWQLPGVFSTAAGYAG